MNAPQLLHTQVPISVDSKAIVNTSFSQNSQTQIFNNTFFFGSKNIIMYVDSQYCNTVLPNSSMFLDKSERSFAWLVMILLVMINDVLLMKLLKL